MTAPDLFESFLASSETMMAAAIQQDWNALLDSANRRDDLEKAIKQRRATELRPLSPREEEIFRRVLVLDQEVRDRVEPWLKHSGKLLARWGALPS